jgi:flagellar biosynthesis/type III secretory pathway protein FliH
MPEMLTIQLSRPVADARVLTTPGEATGIIDARQRAEGRQAEGAHGEPSADVQGLERRTQELAQRCEIVGGIAEKLDKLYQETIARHQAEIAKLAVEIAGKILICRTSRGEYDIQAIVEEALKRAPTRQEITVHVSPDDLPRCQQLQQDNPDGPLAALDFAADWSIARADCLVETPKGMVRSFVEEQLERIGEALMKVE